MNNQISMLISIIVPVYNVKPYLCEALDSILNQSYCNLEIIVIDDGSTDGSGEICEQYAKQDDRFIVIHQENQGLSAARNAGLDIATGDVITFLDSDDALHPDFLKEMIEAMNYEKVDIVVCKFLKVISTEKMEFGSNAEKKPIIKQGKYDRISALRALAEETLNVSVWNKLFKKELWKEVRFPVGQVFEEQKTIFSILNLCCSIYVIDKSLYSYRIRPNSISDTKSVKNISDLILAYSQFDEFIADHTPAIFTTELAKKSHFKLFRRMIGIYIQYSCNTEEDWKDFCGDLRMRIMDMSKEDTREKFDMKTAIAYQMIKYCPGLLRVLYPMYFKCRIAWKKII